MENLQLGANDLKSIFDSVDTDGNGLIEISELYTALKEANGKEFNPETCQLLMGLFDVNEDGHIDMAEFGDLVRYLRNWKGTFGTFVKSKVMGINATQLYTTLKRCGCGLNEQLCKVMVSNFDSHHTGSLAFDDYLRCCVTVQALHKAFLHRHQLPQQGNQGTTSQHGNQGATSQHGNQGATSQHGNQGNGSIGLDFESLLTMVIQARARPVENLRYDDQPT